MSEKESVGRLVTPRPVPSEGMMELWQHFESVGAHMSVFAFKRCWCWCGEQHPFDGDLASAGSIVFYPEAYKKKEVKK